MNVLVALPDDVDMEMKMLKSKCIFYSLEGHVQFILSSEHLLFVS